MAGEHGSTDSSRLGEAVRERFEYSPDTGILTRKSGRALVGYARRDGYIDVDIMVDGVNYRTKAHRLAWFLSTGKWPEGVIDHINGDRSDNRIKNLRDVPSRLNAHNIKAVDIDGGKFRGISSTPGGKYRAEIQDGERRIDLGCWNTPEEAIASYTTAKRLLHAGYLGR